MVPPGRQTKRLVHRNVPQLLHRDNTTLPRSPLHASVGVMVPSASDIDAAAARIAPHVRHTPVLRLAGGDLGLGYPVTLKLELLQHAGSFKPRGAFNRILAAREAAPGFAKAFAAAMTPRCAT